MNLDRGFNLLGAVVGVAAITTIFARPNSVQVIRAIWSGFNDSLGTALGKGISF